MKSNLFSTACADSNKVSKKNLKPIKDKKVKKASVFDFLFTKYSNLLTIFSGLIFLIYFIRNRYRREPVN